ncbi:class I SAM-dependent methyltransferase [Salicibibacter halophilus]|uniref:Class I SAM-dependent methyltransferase n=1 Tax=Salicibibacter halophilus TaxID=2502791 RepID=A0A514LH06_9BACI|nr:class I SAM-dependent methyltransferase [Salicibibacter halophilus]QDI90825.1 class I SAM-dependent methyltransferase [Salicibibacter halophilus]
MDQKWDESDTELFLRYGRVFIPERDELEKAFIDLIPANHDEELVVVDIAAGGGWLTETIVSTFPKAHVIALDGSSEMLDYTKDQLNQYADRLEFRHFDLFDDSWLKGLPNNIRCFVSSLAIHHLDLKQKQDLFKKLYLNLQENGALLIADILKPVNEIGRRSMSRSWDEVTKKQSLDLEDNLQAYEYFLNAEWNLFEHPDDPVDKPSTLLEQLNALEQAGFSDVDAWWVKAGHALFGGYK